METQTSWTFINLQFAIKPVLQKMQYLPVLFVRSVVFARSVRVLYEPIWLSSISPALFMYKSTMLTTSLLHIWHSKSLEKTASCNGDARFVLVPERCICSKLQDQRHNQSKHNHWKRNFHFWGFLWWEDSKVAQIHHFSEACIPWRVEDKWPATFLTSSIVPSHPCELQEPIIVAL